MKMAGENHKLGSKFKILDWRRRRATSGPTPEPDQRPGLQPHVRRHGLGLHAPLFLAARRKIRLIFSLCRNLQTAKI